MMMKLSLAIGLLLLVGAQARLPPKQPIATEESKEVSSSETETSSPSESSSNPASSSSSGDSFENYSPSFSSREREQIHRMFQETMNLFDALRSNLWHSRLHSFHHQPQLPSIFSPSEDDSIESPFTLMMRPPLFIRDPSFSFFNQRPSFNPFDRRTNFPNFNSQAPQAPLTPQIPKGYNKVNETRFVVEGKEFCQTVYEKVENKAGNFFESRVITVQPCEQINSKRDQESKSTESTNESVESEKKDQDRDSIKPQVERENDPKESSLPANSDNVPVSTEVPTKEQPDESNTESETPDVKPNQPEEKKNNENEIPDKAAEPSISVNDK